MQVRHHAFGQLGGQLHGFFNYGLLDTHFSERGRQGRIVRLADHTQVPFAFGVDENTALLVQNNPTLGLTYERNPRFRVDLFKSTQFDSHGYQGTVAGKSMLSYLRLLMDVRPN